MDYLFVAIRAVVAMAITAKRFKSEQNVEYIDLLGCIARILKEIKPNNTCLFFHNDTCDRKWRCVMKLDKSVENDDHTVVTIKFNTSTSYDIKISILIDNIRYSLVWNYEQLDQLDTSIANVIIKYISKEIVDLTHQVKVVKKLYLTEDLKQNSMVIFNNIIQFVDTLMVIEAKISANGIEIEITKNRKSVENIVISWDQFIDWLE